VIERLQNIRKDNPGELNVRVLIDFGDKGQWEADLTDLAVNKRYTGGVLIDFGDKGQWEADLTDLAVNKRYTGGSEVGIPLEVIIMHERVGT